MKQKLPDLRAAIDIGSHSCILLIAAFETDENGKEKLVPKIQKIEVCRLGEDIYESGKITAERQEELSRILSRFRSDVHALGAKINEAVATEAMRKAENSEEVLDSIEKALWKRPRIISGEEEASYTYRAVTEWHGEDIVTIDIGGGSTELCFQKKSMSIPVGALLLFKKMGAVPGPEYKAFAKETLKNNPVKAFAKKSVFLVGGTATALAMVFLNIPQFDYEKLEGIEMTLNDLEMTITRIVNLSKELRSALPGLGGGRSDVIICGLYWLRSLLERLHVETFRISTAGLRFGILYPPQEEILEPEKPKRKFPFQKKNLTPEVQVEAEHAAE